MPTTDPNPPSAAGPGALVRVVDALGAVLARTEALLSRLEQTLPGPLQAPDWDAAQAWVYRCLHSQSGRNRNGGTLHPVLHPHQINFAELREIDGQKEKIIANTEQFLRGLPANNVLLTGARGTGKSSLVKACLTAYAQQGLRLIEIDKNDMSALPDIVDLVQNRPERFIVYCDDLSFEEGETGYKALKSVLDGSLHTHGQNLLIYATSNRRHLVPEYMHENLGYRHQAGEELHPSEVVEEKISLSERFGLWISFYPFAQEEYLGIVSQCLANYGLDKAAIEAARPQALLWALERGARSGRTAAQFAKDYIGKTQNAVAQKKAD